MNQPLLPNTLLQNRYRVESLLGQGGMGAVYKAWDLRLSGHTVAVKENFETSPEAQSQFQTEAVLLAHLQHPMLPRVTDHFVEPGGRQYLVMDYIEGDDLDQVVTRSGAVAESQAIVWLTQILNAVEYLHTQPRPIIHRDIKPANIKIRPDRRAVLVDFGIAKAQVQGQKTVAGAQAFSPGYSPLEQYGYGSTDARSDIYSLGATLYFMLTGHRPPEARDLATGTQTLTPPSRLGTAVTPQTETALLKAMAMQPAQRFQSVAAFRDVLNPQIGTQRIYTQPASAPQPLVALAPPAAYAQPQSIAQPAPVPLPTAPPLVPATLPAAVVKTFYASYWRRLFAYLLDIVLLIFVGMIIVFAGGLLDGLSGMSRYDSTSSSFTGPFTTLAQCFYYVVAFLYFVVLTGKYGQTLGKKVLGIQVVKPATGLPPGFGSAFVRNFIFGLEVIAFYILVGFLGVLWPLWDKQKQAWHDKAANTIVIRA